MGHGDDRRLQEVLKYLHQQKVDWQATKANYVLYAWYYITQAMFQAGGDDWTYWNQQIRDSTVRAQSEWEHKSIGHSLVYNMTLGALILEVYYRYLPLYQLMEQQQQKPNEPAPGTPKAGPTATQK